MSDAFGYITINYLPIKERGKVLTGNNRRR
jgi:hypothetical protein